MSSGQRARFLLVFGLGLYLAGSLLRPLHGINKNAATDAYALVTGAVCCLSFLGVYGVMDLAKFQRWAAPLIPAGQNPLLAYVLPGMLANLLAVLGLEGILWQSTRGWPGALNAAALTVLVLALTWAATKAGIRLRL